MSRRNLFKVDQRASQANFQPIRTTAGERRHQQSPMVNQRLAKARDERWAFSSLLFSGWKTLSSCGIYIYIWCKQHLREPLSQPPFCFQRSSRLARRPLHPKQRLLVRHSASGSAGSLQRWIREMKWSRECSEIVAACRPLWFIAMVFCALITLRPSRISSI